MPHYRRAHELVLQTFDKVVDGARKGKTAKSTAYQHSGLPCSPCRRDDCASIESSMSKQTSRRQNILDQISDRSVKKLIIMRWWERGEIEPSEAENLIRSNGLEAA